MTFKWPTRDDYDLALKSLHLMALDDDLKHGQVTEDMIDVQGIRRFGGAGLYSSTYQVTTPPTAINRSGIWMVRCFCTTSKGEPPKDIRERYHHISTFCLDNYTRYSALLPIFYVEPGLTVEYVDYITNSISRVERVPIIKMPYIKAMSLGSYIAISYEKKELMEQLCHAWLVMLRELEKMQMAHGDLDLTNVLVVQDGMDIRLKLIDYDNAWLPALRHLTQTEFGHEAFQHPWMVEQKQRPYNAEMDRFSALSMYISLRALIMQPDLYKQWQADDTHQLLFSKEDYVCEMNPSQASYRISRLAQLSTMNMYALRPYLDELRRALREHTMPCRIDDVPPPPPVVISMSDTQDETVKASSQDWKHISAPIPAALSAPPVPVSPRVREQESTTLPSAPLPSGGTPPGKKTSRPGRQEEQGVYASVSPITSPARNTSSKRIWIITLIILALVVLVLVGVIIWLVIQSHTPPRTQALLLMHDLLLMLHPLHTRSLAFVMQHL